MQPKISHAAAVILAALALGITADQLLKGGPWGVNILLVCLLFLGVVAGIARLHGAALTGGGRGFALPLALFAALFVLRDSAALSFWNGLALLACLLLFAARSATGRVLTGSLTQRAIDLLRAGVAALFGGFSALLRVRATATGTMPRGGVFIRILLGVLIALPLLAVFGALFSSADAGFEQLLRQLLDFDTGNLAQRVVISLLLSWLCAGLLGLIFLEAHSPVPGTAAPGAAAARWAPLGIVEIGVVLGLLIALFAVFVASQLRYFFGGAAVVLDAGSQFTYAAYARRGFFELVAVSMLSLLLLLGMHRFTRFNSPRAGRVFGLLAGALIALLFVIMASALNRMRLYMAVYGLSELRIYATAIMLWLAVVLLWFAWTTLRAPDGLATQYFAFGALISALITLLALNLINPVDLIVRTNVDRILANAAAASDPAAAPVTGGEFRQAERLDAQYLAGLGRNNADAVPALISALSRLAPDDACVIANGLYDRETQSGGWRHWNSARQRAIDWILPNQKMIGHMICPGKGASD